MSKMPIKTAVLPVAGMGTRFLPVTKAGPKEMLPVVDKPVIQYVVEEALSAGINHFVFVTSATKRAIEDYFDTNFELETRLKERGKTDALFSVQNILPNGVTFSYVRQSQPLGLGHAVLCAKEVVGEQAFAVLLPDIVIDSGTAETCLQGMVRQYNHHHASVIAIESVPSAQTDQYGIVALQKNIDADRILSLVEKPPVDEAPSNLAVTGRYILTPRIFSLLEQTPRGVGGEIQLTDAIQALLMEEPVFAHRFKGQCYDCGSKIGLLQATIAYALKRNDLREPLLAFLQSEVGHFATVKSTSG